MLKFCRRCCMDGTAEITFDENGVCNFCDIAQKELVMAEHEKSNWFKRLKKIKDDGKGKKYDCIIGLSGGVDSSTTLHHAVKAVRPLCFTFDNGYNLPAADENVRRMVQKLGVPLIRINVNEERYKDLQSAFIKAGLPNIEIPTDHILMAVTFALAAKYKIKWILSGGNVATESIMPLSWSYPARDLPHIKDVYKKMTGKKLKGLPLCGIWLWNWYRWIKRIKIFYLLDYMDYRRDESIKMLEKEYGFQDYGEKHCESIFTWWFQNYYLFEKFNIDKRKAHYSSLINSGQLSREIAMESLKTAPEYPKLGIEGKIMKLPKSSHYDFKNDVWFNRISKVIRYVKRF